MIRTLMRLHPVVSVCAAILVIGLLLAVFGVACAGVRTDIYWIGVGLTLSGAAVFALLLTAPLRVLTGCFFAGALGCVVGTLAGSSALVAICAAISGILAILLVCKLFDFSA